MGRLFSKKYHQPGTAPGTLRRADDFHGGLAPSDVVWRLVEFDGGVGQGAELSGAEALIDSLTVPVGSGPGYWIDIQGTPSADELHALGSFLGLHPLALEDVLNGGQRPKAEIFDGVLTVTLGIPVEQSKGGEYAQSVVIRQLTLFSGDGYVLSILGGAVSGSRSAEAGASVADPFGEVRRRFMAPGAPLRGETGNLVYAIIDAAVDHAFPALDAIGERIEALELAILDRPTHRALEHLHAIKRELIVLRRHLWPTRDVINQLLRDHGDRFSDETHVWMRDVYDHTVQIMDLIESYRDMTASLLDIYLSSMSNRTNETMRTLTVIATVFMPLTFIVGLYGMNFENPESPYAMPELGWYYGYPLAWVLMIVVALMMIWLFRRNRWL